MFKKILIGALLAVAIVAGIIIATHRQQGVVSMPSPSVSASPTPTSKVSASPSPVKTTTPSPIPTATHTPSPTPSHTPTTTPTASPTPTPIASPTPSPTPTASPTPTPTPTPTPGPQTVVVTMQDFSFNPGTINVQPGDIVRFINNDSFSHSAVDDGGAWTSPVLSQGQSYDLDTTNLPLGTYRYHCGVHGAGEAGTLRIRIN